MKFTRLTTEREVWDLVNWHNQYTPIVDLDVETDSLDTRKARWLSTQMTGYEKDSAVYFEASISQPIKRLSRKIRAWGRKYDDKILRNNGILFAPSQWINPLLIAHLVDERRSKDGRGNSLGDWVLELYQDTYKKEFWSKYKEFEDAPEDVQLEYGCKDIIYMRWVTEHLLKECSKQNIPSSLIEHVHRLEAALIETEISGIAIDIEYLTEKGIDLKAKMEYLLPEMRELAQGYCEVIELDLYNKELDKRKTDKGKANVAYPKFSFDSAAQLKSLLYSHLKLPVQKNEKTKNVSTDTAALDALQDLHPIIPKIQEYRDCKKIYSTYIEGTLEQQENGRVFPLFNVNGTKTGRLSHSNPNLAQLPKAGGIRGIYIPDPGHVFLSRDYSQLEVVLEANLTGDANLKRICLEGLSKHDITNEALGLNNRGIAKILNFAAQYHCSAFKFAKILGVSQEQAEIEYKKYWDTYAGCRDLKKRTDDMVDKGIPIRSLWGRIRHFDKRRRQPWDGDYRQAYNFIIQSPGSDLTSKAFYIADERLRAKGYGHCLFTVHDEILIQAKKEFALQADEILAKSMIEVGEELGLSIPLSTSGSGPMDRWLSK